MQSTELKPEVETDCVVCGWAEHQLVCSAEQLRAQVDYLRDFHRRRMRRGGRNALVDRAEFTQDYLTDIVACGGCGLIRREQRPHSAAVLAAYKEDEYGPERLAALFDSQLETFRAKVDDLQRQMPSQHRPFIVEVGSFVGGFLAAVSERGWEAVGLDPGKEVVEYCRGKGLRVHRGTAADAPIADAIVDCVAIWNTFDQLPDPRPTLAAARRWLRPGGLLVLRVPNGAAFRTAMRLLRTLPVHGPLRAALAWNNLLGFPYLYGYSVPPLDRLLAEAGFYRRFIQPDTLVRLADGQTAEWAAAEERLLKFLWRSAARLDRDVAPWFDAYYTRMAGPERGAQPSRQSGEAAGNSAVEDQ